MFFAIGTKPLSVAMKLKTEWKSGEDQKIEQDQHARASAAG
jgi:hypothetical protein